MRYLIEFWPALLPLLMCLLWVWRKRARARADGFGVPPLHHGPWLWALLASAGIVVALLFWLGASTEGVKGEYVPPHMENGRLIPGHIERGAP